jgi:hypothetical protein
VDWDDDINFVNNLEFRGLGRANLRFMLTTTLMGHWIPPRGSRSAPTISSGA